MEMTITRALTELKKIDHKTSSAISAGFYTAIVIGEGATQRTQSSFTVEELENRRKSTKDTVDSLLARKIRIKVALNKSNAETIVKVLGREMSVAEAIELKAQKPMKTHLVEVAKKTLAHIKNEVIKINTRVDEEILDLTKKSLEVPTEKDMNDAIIMNVKASKRASVLKEVELTQYIEALELEIAELDENLDFTLSESNSVTIITIAD